MRVTIHQPYYIPWAGYFHKIALSDLFIFLDTVQFQKNGFMNRNKIKTPQGVAWLTVPVSQRGHLCETLSETKINNQMLWQKKHWRSISMNYRKAGLFEELSSGLERFYVDAYDKFVSLCFDMLMYWLDYLRIPTMVLRASELQSKGVSSQYILELCKEVGANEYLSGPMGRDYLDLSEFADAGISVGFHEYDCPTYSQFYGDFVTNLSILDMAMHVSEPVRLLLEHNGNI